MRQRWVLGTLVIALALSAGAGAWAATTVRQQIEVEYRQIQIQVDGKTVTVDAEPFLHIQAGRTFIPARPLAEALGAKVEWDDATSTVQVYTQQYVTARVEGESRIWSMPGAGFTIRSPLGWVRQEGDPSALLHLALPGTSGMNGLVAVTRLPEDPAVLASQFDQVIEGMRFIYTDLALSNRQESPGRISAAGTANLAGTTVGILFRLVEAKGGNWMLFGLYPQDAQATMAPAVQAMVDSFVQK